MRWWQNKVKRFSRKELTLLPWNPGSPWFPFTSCKVYNDNINNKYFSVVRCSPVFLFNQSEVRNLWLVCIFPRLTFLVLPVVALLSFPSRLSSRSLISCTWNPFQEYWVPLIRNLRFQEENLYTLKAVKGLIIFWHMWEEERLFTRGRANINLNSIKRYGRAMTPTFLSRYPAVRIIGRTTGPFSPCTVSYCRKQESSTSVKRKDWQAKSTIGNAGFSVAFGSTGCSGSGGGRAPFAPLALTLSAGGTNS